MLYFLMYFVYIMMYCNCEKEVDLDIFTDLEFFSLFSQHEKLAFGMPSVRLSCVYVCMYVCMYYVCVCVCARARAFW
jgi:hypothetical protein